MSAIPEDYAGVPPADDPAYAYGRGKRIGEQLCLDAWQAGGPVPVIARCFAFVGPHLPLDAHFAAGNFIRNALRGEPIQVKGDGSPLRSYLYAADLAIWLWTSLFAAPGGRPFNVGSEAAISIADLARAVAALCGSASPIAIAQMADSDRLPARYVPDTRRAAGELRLRVRVPLAEALLRTIRWHTHVAA